MAASSMYFATIGSEGAGDRGGPSRRQRDSRDASMDKESDEGIWSCILTQVQTQSANKLPANKSILVLGENGSGKTSLIAKMQGNDDPRKGCGLEFHHLLVRDDYRDESTRLGVWILDGDPSHAKLLKFALHESTLTDTLVLITVGMNQPWTMMDSLTKWAQILEKHLKSLKLSGEKLNHCEHTIARRFAEYVSPGDEIESLAAAVSGPSASSAMTISTLSSSGRATLSHSSTEGTLVNGNAAFSDEDATPTSPTAQQSHLTNSQIDLPEGVLTHNLGLEIVVVVTLTDSMASLEKEFDFREEHFDFVQQAVRKFCLQYGASLFYTSAKANKNCDLLYKYIVNRIYGLPFKTPALVVEKDAVFIPSGWDNWKKIAILYDNIQSFSPDDEFNDIIQKPSQRKMAQREIESTADEDQTFLIKMQSQLSVVSGSGSGGSSSTGVGNGQGGVGSNFSTPSGKGQLGGGELRVSPALSGVKGGDPRRSLGTPQMDAKGSPGNEGVLQNFFNSLLNRKSTGMSPASGGTPSGSGGISDSPLSTPKSHRANNGGGGPNLALNHIFDGELNSSLDSANANEISDSNGNSNNGPHSISPNEPS